MKIQLTKTRLGRALRRLVGEETGAVLMEYVVLAVLMVAAVVGAVIVFGNRIAHRFDEAGIATTGSQTSVEAAQTDNQAQDRQSADAAYSHQKTISGGDYEPSAGGGSGGGTGGGEG